MVSHSTEAGYMDRAWRLCKPRRPDADARSDGSARTVDEAVDLEALAFDDGADDDYPRVSGLPLVCSNCGVSFFSLQIPDDQVDCYCSGECKWSVIMYREMDLRMFAMRRPARRRSAPGSSCSCSSSSCFSDGVDADALASLSFSDDSTASLSCS